MAPAGQRAKLRELCLDGGRPDKYRGRRLADTFSQYYERWADGVEEGYVILCRPDYSDRWDVTRPRPSGARGLPV